MNKTLAAIFLVLLSCATCFAQSTYLGLTPGVSTRVNVESDFGKPIQSVSRTLIEYQPPAYVDASKIYVQYADDSPAARVVRIEMVCHYTGLQDNKYQACFNLYEKFVSDAQVKPTDDAFKQIDSNSSGALRELDYYGGPAFLVFTRLIKDRSHPVEDRIGLYSKELYESTVPKSCTGFFEGVWDTSRGRMVITETKRANRLDRTHAKGSFLTNGTFEGDIQQESKDPFTVIGFSLEGTWKDDTGTGTMKLLIPDDIKSTDQGVIHGNRQRNTFTGTWKRTSGKGPRDGTWEGRCVEAK